MNKYCQVQRHPDRTPNFNVLFELTLIYLYIYVFIIEFSCAYSNRMMLPMCLKVISLVGCNLVHSNLSLEIVPCEALDLLSYESLLFTVGCGTH